MKRKLLYAGIGLVAILGVAWVILFEWSPRPRGEFSIELPAVRALAGTKALPVRVNAVLVGTSLFPAKAAVAGAGMFDERPFSNAVYQVVYANGETALIDTANDEYLHRKWSNGQFFADAYAKLESAMLRARAIVITHEHFDHIGGISRSKNIDRLRANTVLTAEQLTGPTLHWAEFPPGATQKFRPLSYERFHALLPGMVLIKAPGHTTGSQIIYVRLASGAEFLFVGDIAWQMESIEKERGKALFAALMSREVRSQVLPQLAALNAIRKNTKVKVIVSHDMAQLRALHQDGTFGKDFEATAPR